MADTSPTGIPVLPTKFVPFVALLPTLIVAIGQAVPAHTWFAHVAPGLAAAVGGLLGIASPGLRK